MDEVCSLQLLTSVRRMVLTLTQQNDESKEFVRFFHRQLGGILQVGSVPIPNSSSAVNPSWSRIKKQNKTAVLIFHSLLLLQDSLSKFVGRTLKDCGEDLLVEISEILFNELAFFRLMQDLDNSSSVSLAAKHKNKKRAEQASKAKCTLKVSFFFFFLFTLCGFANVIKVWMTGRLKPFVNLFLRLGKHGSWWQ